MSQSSVVELNSGKKIVYSINGNTDGQPLVLLHGWCGAHSLFVPLIGNFTPDFLKKYKIISPTLFGHGDSSKPAENAPNDEVLKMCTMEQYAEDVKDFLDKVGASKPIILAGHSMGGAILFNFVAKYPDLVKTIIAMGTWCHMEEVDKTNGKMLVDGVKSGLISMDREGRAIGFIQNAFDRNTQKDPAKVNAILDIIMKTPTNLTMACYENFIFHNDILEQIKAIKKPTLILHGARDKVCAPPKGEQIRDTIAGSQLVMIPKGSHTFFFDQPEVVASEIEKFLAQL